MGIEGVCDDCDDGLGGSVVWGDIADGLPAALPSAGFGFARLRGPMVGSSSKKTILSTNMWMCDLLRLQVFGLPRCVPGGSRVPIRCKSSKREHRPDGSSSLNGTSFARVSRFRELWLQLLWLRAKF